MPVQETQAWDHAEFGTEPRPGDGLPRPWVVGVLVGVLVVSLWVRDPGTTPPDRSIRWGPDVPVYLVDGTLWVGQRTFRAIRRVRTFTVVRGGVVLEQAGSGLVWLTDFVHAPRLVRSAPQHLVSRDPRSVVGDVRSDVVVWIPDDTFYAPIDVIRASTGQILATGYVPARSSRLDVMSVGPRDIYVTVHPRRDPYSVHATWRWRWRATRTARQVAAAWHLPDEARDGTWLVESPRGDTFSRDGDPLVTLPTGIADGTFRDALSPDGRWYFAPSRGGVVASATGRFHAFRGLAAATTFSWTAVDRVTVVSERGVTVCRVGTWRCTLPLPVDPDARQVLTSAQ